MYEDKVYVNLEDLISLKDWKDLKDSGHFDEHDLVVRGLQLRDIWIRVLGNEKEATKYLYDLMESGKSFIKYVVESSITKRVRIFREGKVIFQNGGRLEVEVAGDIIMIDEYNRCDERVGNVIMNWESYEELREYLDNMKKNACD